jgi:carbon-monoxide dehydrogenase large subunit
MRRADNLPSLETALSEVPSPTNRLGVRSEGEGGTTSVLAAVINAAVDALTELAVPHIKLPATPERVWRAIQAAGQAQPRKPTNLLRPAMKPTFRSTGTASES